VVKVVVLKEGDDAVTTATALAVYPGTRVHEPEPHADGVSGNQREEMDFLR